MTSNKSTGYKDKFVKKNILEGVCVSVSVSVPGPLKLGKYFQISC